MNIPSMPSLSLKFFTCRSRRSAFVKALCEESLCLWFPATASTAEILGLGLVVVTCTVGVVSEDTADVASAEDEDG